MREVACVLHELNGSIFTGCDLNVDMRDMEALSSLCPYVLASVGCPTSANLATGHGVYASIVVRLLSNEPESFQSSCNNSPGTGVVITSYLPPAALRAWLTSLGGWRV